MRPPEAELEGASPKPFPLILAKRASILLLVVCLLATFFWAAGSLRSFLEGTQLTLLAVLRWASLALLLASLLGFLLSLAYVPSRPRASSILGLLGYLLLAAYGAAGLVLANGLVALNRGLP